MDKNDKMYVINIEEFKKHNKIDEEFKKYNKQEEPFSELVNKLFFVIGHALELVQFELEKNCWYIDTRSYDLLQIGNVLTTYYYRWEFDDPLPKKLLKYIPFDIEMAKLAPIIIGADKVFVMPTMCGIVEKIIEKENKFFIVKNPEII